MKKLLSFALASAMALSVGTTALATTSTTNTTDIEGTYTPITIAVDVPAAGSIAINPYALNVAVNVDGNGGSYKIKDQQIVTQPLAIVNRSDMDLNVSAKVTGVLPVGASGATNNFKLAPDVQSVVGSATAVPAVPPSTYNSGCLAFQMAVATSTVTSADASDNVFLEEYAKWASTPFTIDTEKDIVVGTKMASKNNIIVLRAANASGAVQPGGVGFFRIGGVVVQEPKIPWSVNDKVNVSIAFTFTPAKLPALTLDTTTKSVTASAGATFTLASTLTNATAADGTFAWTITPGGSNGGTAAIGTDITATPQSDTSKCDIVFPSTGLNATDTYTITVTWTSSDDPTLTATATCNVTIA